MKQFFINMFPNFLFENPIIKYIVDYIGNDLEEINKRIINETDYDI